MWLTCFCCFAQLKVFITGISNLNPNAVRTDMFKYHAVLSPGAVGQTDWAYTDGDSGNLHKLQFFLFFFFCVPVSPS